jgi:DNA repair exonuclease SbcCD ATPase subunit
METAMLNEVRDTLGKFAPKSELPRKVRSVNLKDDAWQWLVAVVKKAEMSRNDYLEALAEGQNPFMETAKPQPQPFMETAKTKGQVDVANIEKQPDTEVYPFIETVRTEVESVKLELEAVCAENQLLQLETNNLQAEREELAQLKKETKEVVAELHREERSMELEKVRWQRELSDARAELADAKATILTQSNKIRELERGYSFKPSPKEAALRREIGELRSQLETERADREKIEAELSELKQNSAPTATLFEKLTLDAAIILSQLRARRKKFTATLGDVEKILEILEASPEN